MFKKIPFLEKFRSPAPRSLSAGKSGFEKNGDSQPETADLLRQKELDKKLVYSLNKTKIPSLKQIKHLPKVLKPKELLLFRGLGLLAAVCLIIIALNFYLRNFLPVPIVGGEYTEGLIGAPQYINPILCQTNDVDSDISRLIFSGLLKYDAKLQLIADIAESWQVSTDQKTYTFILKNSLRWHDDKPLTADDVVFTYKSIQDRDFKSPLLVSLRGVEVQKIDERTVKFILPEAYPAFLEVLTTGILPEHVWGEIPPLNANLTEYNLKPVGSGPWKFKSLAKDRLGNIRSYVIVPNLDYPGPKPYLEKITFKFYPDFANAVSALQGHSIEGISFLPKEDKNELTGQKAIKYYSFDLPQYTAVFFNQKQNEVLKEKNVRKALALGIDKSKILADALQLEGKIIQGPLLPFSLELGADKIINFDPAAANQALEDAGWKKISAADYQAYLNEQKAKAAEAEKKKDKTSAAASSTSTPTTTAAVEEELPQDYAATQELYRKKNDSILEITLTTVNQPENVKAAELIQGFWQNIGVKTNLEIVDRGRISRDVIKPRNYQVLLFGMIVGANADPYPFWHSSQVADPGLNLALVANREVDKLLEEARKTTDLEKQKQDYQKFQDILAADIPAVFLYNPTYTYVVDKKIKGIGVNRVIIPADRFNNLDGWYTKTKRTWQGKLK